MMLLKRMVDLGDVWMTTSWKLMVKSGMGELWLVELRYGVESDRSSGC